MTTQRVALERQFQLQFALLELRLFGANQFPGPGGAGERLLGIAEADEELVGRRVVGDQFPPGGFVLEAFQQQLSVFQGDDPLDGGGAQESSGVPRP